MSDPVEAPSLTRAQKSLIKMRRGIFALGLLALVWILFGQAVPRLFMSHRPAAAPQNAGSAAPSDSQLGEMKTQIDELQAKVKALEDVIAASPKSADGDARIDALQAKIDALQQTHGENAADDGRIAHLEETINKQQEILNALTAQLSDVQNKGSHQLAALTAFTSLRDAIARGEPYQDQLTELNQQTLTNPKAQELLKQLMPDAPAGSVTLTALQSQFDALVTPALAPSAGGISHTLSSLIRVRKVGEQQTGLDDQSVIARAEARLSRNDVDGALRELKGLSPPAATAYAPWLAKAQQFMQTRGTLEALQLVLADEPAPSVPATAPATAPTPAPIPTPAPPPQAAPAGGTGT